MTSLACWRRVRTSIPSRPLDLAVLRIVVVANVLLSPDLRDALRWSKASAALALPPSRWYALPADPGLVTVAFAAALIAGAAALVGWRSRASCAVLAALSFYLLAIPQRSGTVTHTHHLVWFLVIVAVGRSGDALSVDAALRARSHALRSRSFAVAGRPDPACALAIASAWMLVGLIFFFPGAWKLLASGGAWLDGSALRGQLHWKWFENGWTPSVRIDRSALGCRLGGIATVLFELSFGLLVFSRRLRVPAIAGAVLFHVFTAAFMRVYFSSLWTAYVMFFDWDLVLRSIGKAVAPRGIEVRYAEDGGPRHVRCAVLRTLDVAGIGRWSGERAPETSAPLPRQRAPIVPVILMAMGLLLPNLLMGVLGETRAWPFACYPTFHRTPGELAPGLLIEAEDAAGRVTPVPHGPELAGDRRQRAWATVFSLLSADPARIEAYVREALEHPRAREAASGARRLRIYRAWYATDPGQRDAGPIRRELLLELRGDPPER